MNSDIKKLHVIFKTHLDVGFTDYAHKVVARYFSEFMPQAIRLSQQLRAGYPQNPFCWTVGSWLVYEYLEQASTDERRLMEEAITEGHINWHALPFTVHTEFMDADLMRYGLSLSQRLDERFGKQTIAAKMTDVPGHTRALVPLLAEAGVRFLHIGVNPAATVPSVPPVFVWRDAQTDTEVLCMYQQVYGDTMVLPGTDEAVSLIFTGDNLGPPSLDSVLETYASLQETFPQADFVGATLDDTANIILNADVDLPIVTSEIGDSWIHGVGSDPTKTSQYRELLRLRHQWLESDVQEETLRAFYHKLLMIPEHTWGMDLKTHLQDYEHYLTPALAAVRHTPNFANFEASWAEQREYIDAALGALPAGPLSEQAEQALMAIRPKRTRLAGGNRTDERRFSAGRWEFEFDEKGALIHLCDTQTDTLWADEAHALGHLQYETFSAEDYERFWQQYIRDREFGDVRVWAHPDNTKPQMPVEHHQTWHPSVQDVYCTPPDESFHLQIRATLPSPSEEIGAPKELIIGYSFRDDAISIELQWFDKPAARLAEAFWLSFNPIMDSPISCQIEKLGQWISPTDVVSNGGRTLHATEGNVVLRNDTRHLMVTSLDAALVAPGRPSLLDFHNNLPDLSGGLHFNLFNNVWGTNFTMWFDDDARFRFVLRPLAIS